jgi:Fur family transcriptional regulator, ferric uptake regulator
MTLAPDVKPLAVEDPAGAVRELRASGLRISTARRLMIEALFAAEGPVSAAHLVAALSLDESSVYRNLELLEQHGLVRHLHLGHGPGLYVLAGGAEAEYLYCDRCGKVKVVAPAELDPVREQIRERFGYVPRFTHFAIVGLCDDCAAHPPDRPDSRPGELHSHGEYLHAHAHRGAHSHARRN